MDLTASLLLNSHWCSCLPGIQEMADKQLFEGRCYHDTYFEKKKQNQKQRSEGTERVSNLPLVL